MIDVDSITVSMKYETEILIDLLAGKLSGKEIAAKYKVWPSHVSNIRKKHFKDGAPIQAPERRKAGRKRLNYDVRKIQVRFSAKLFERVENAARSADQKPTEFIIDLCEKEV